MCPVLCREPPCRVFFALDFCSVFKELKDPDLFTAWAGHADMDGCMSEGRILSF
jgi:hypothetical protein